MTTKAKPFLIMLAMAAVTASAAPTAADAPEPSGFDKFLNEIKNPADWFTWGGDIRVRNEYSDSILTLRETVPGSEQDVIRFRGRIWGSATPVTNVSVNARLSAEPRLWMNPAFAAQYRNQTGMEWRYGIMDNLNVQWKYAFDQPLTVVAGRQDILLGDYYDWWLVADGTPGDGSWTFFLDSVRATYEMKEVQTKFDVIYIYQNAQADETLPTIDKPYNQNVPYGLTDQREQGVILYASNKTIENMQADGYFMWKNDNRVYATGDNGNIYTLGAKITGTAGEHFAYSVEGAYQMGEKEDWIQGDFEERDLKAYGGKAKLSYLFKDKWNNQLSLVGEYLSGDDPDTEDDEMFDVLWGRWPRWSELYIYSYAPETGGRIAQLNNIARFGPAWSVNPAKGLTFTAMYNAFYAPQEVPTRAVAPFFSNDGNFRGHYLQTILKYQFNKHWVGHLWGEWVWEGDFYAQRDLMKFLRAEILFSF